MHTIDLSMCKIKDRKAGPYDLLSLYILPKTQVRGTYGEISNQLPNYSSVCNFYKTNRFIIISLIFVRKLI